MNNLIIWFFLTKTIIKNVADKTLSSQKKQKV